MAITKILARKARLDIGIDYILNGDKTEDQILTAQQNCDPGQECRQMLATKEAVGKLDGIQYYHMIQSFRPGEISPKLALEIAKSFAAEHLQGYEAVIATHVDRGHIHSHIVFNSVNADTGEKYHSNAQSYYQQIRAVSDRICQEHGLSVILSGEPSKSVSYVEWLRQSKGQPTFRSMLEADLRESIEDANDIGHFFLIMEHKGYEISHGGRLGFRLRGQERYQYPGRRNPLFTEDGIRAAIEQNLEEIDAGHKPAFVSRTPYRPYQKHPKYTGLMALYVHYLYLLGKVKKRQYPPRMTPRLRQEVVKFEQYKEQFAFLRENDISTQEDLIALEHHIEKSLTVLTKQRTLLNVQKKRKQELFSALADESALAQSKVLYEDGRSGMEEEFTQYIHAVRLLDGCGITRDQLTEEKARLYTQLADINQEIRIKRKKLKLCQDIQQASEKIQEDIRRTEITEKEVEHDEHRRR